MAASPAESVILAFWCFFNRAGLLPSRDESLCYTLAALCHLAITQVLGFSGYGLGSQVMGWVLGSQCLDISFSSCAAPTFYRGPGISYVSQDLGYSDTQVGKCRVRCEDVRVQGRVETKLNRR